MDSTQEETGLNRIPERDDKGRLLPGNKTSQLGGRPKGSALDLMTICRRKAKETNTDLSDIVWGAITGLAEKAEQGDAACAKILLDRLCGPVEKAVEVNVDARGLNSGPTLPQGGALGDYLSKLFKVATSQGLLGDSTPEEIIEGAVEEKETNE